MVIRALCALIVFGVATSIVGCGSSGGAAGSPGNPAPTPAVHNEWTWESGSNLTNQPGIYGSLDITFPSSTPGARNPACSFTDKQGALWLFGGYGEDASDSGNQGDLNDLWRFSAGQWTWMGGSNQIEANGVYGTKGMASASNVPGGRTVSSCWTDASGNFWLFGGIGHDSTGLRSDLNDLWRYSSGMWTWMSGSNTGSDYGTSKISPAIYGTQGVPAAANTPGARFDAMSWADPSGNLWLFGGEGLDTNGNFGLLNDLWKFSGGQWTWVNGPNIEDQLGSYGTMGVASPSNVPGSRTYGATWTDASGNLWLFGGQGNDLNGLLCTATAGPCVLNDLWKFSGGQWTWMGGSNVVEASGTYGTQGVPASGNFPGARQNAATWTDASGTMWLFGGLGFAASQGNAEVFGDLNDLWKYNGGQWTWVNGPNLAPAAANGVYGTVGVTAPADMPGARDSAVTWVDLNGDLWLFGGGDYLSFAGNGKFNDLWKYQP